MPRRRDRGDTSDALDALTEWTCPSGHVCKLVTDDGEAPICVDISGPGDFADTQ